jgi:hypothetical protein
VRLLLKFVLQNYGDFVDAALIYLIFTPLKAFEIKDESRRKKRDIHTPVPLITHYAT